MEKKSPTIHTKKVINFKFKMLKKNFHFVYVGGRNEVFFF